jgi:hypothetical protein
MLQHRREKKHKTEVSSILPIQKDLFDRPGRKFVVEKWGIVWKETMIQYLEVTATVRTFAATTKPVMPPADVFFFWRALVPKIGRGRRSGRVGINNWRRSPRRRKV